VCLIVRARNYPCAYLSVCGIVRARFCRVRIYDSAVLSVRNCRVRFFVCAFVRSPSFRHVAFVYVFLMSTQCVDTNRGNFCAANCTYALLLLSFLSYPPPIRNGAKITGHCPSAFIIVANSCLFFPFIFRLAYSRSM
jgi:hypothetical protein